MKPAALIRQGLPQILTCLALSVLAFVQEPGRIVPDTKLDLTADPWRFLGRATDLWDPSGFGGQLQNQAYGYLFPMGPFFAVGDAVGLPAWVVQRLWWALLLCVACLGMYTLARRLDIGSPGTQLLAAIAYALSPRILSTLGPVSAEAWPMALAPWVIVPLVMGAAGGSYRRRAMLSGLAVAAMGGVNAALVLAAIAPAGLYLLTRRPGERSIRLAAWWAGSVVVATVWWVVPLLILGRYSPPFLDYIESARVTTGPTSLAEVIRGTSHWLGFLGPGLGSPWRAGHDLVTEPALILDTVVLAALGLAGLTLRRLPERVWLVSMLLVGAIAVGFGHAGPGTVWFSGAERDLLDGVLAPLRNVHKFDPLIRIPLVLGMAHGLAVVVGRARDRSARTAAWAVVGLTVVATVGGAGPALAGRVAPEGSYDAVPSYWRQAADWLDEHADGRALLAPGSRFAVYTWGSTNDEPLQALTDAPWEVRNAIPLVPAGHIRMLDAVERRFEAGQPSNGLAGYLARAGIGYVVVRNDLDRTRLGTPRPVLVHQVLQQSPGFRRVAVFGPRIGVAGGVRTVVDNGLQPTYPAVEVWALDDPPRPLSVTPLRDVTTVVGGPESLLDLADAGVLPDRPTVLAADGPAWTGSRPAVLTDGLRRREVDFGADLDNASQTLTRSDPPRLDQPALDYAVSGNHADQTVAVWRGVRAVTASTSASDAGARGGSQPARQPAAAFDGRLETAWIADPATAGTAQWLRVDLAGPAVLHRVRVVLPRGTTSVGEVVVRTDDATTTTPVGSLRRVTVDLDPRPTSWVTVELRPTPESVEPVGIAELRLPGITPTRIVRTPNVPSASRPPAAIALAAPTGYRPGCVTAKAVLCSPALIRSGEEDAGLVREVTVPAARDYRLSARLAPAPGSALERWIGRLTGMDPRVSASSSSVDDPRGGPLAAVDGRTSTAWIAGPFDAEPTLTLSWKRPTSVHQVRLVHRAGLAASAPGRVVVEASGRSYDVAVRPDGALDGLPRLRTKRLTLRLHDPIRRFTVDPVTELSTPLPIGISEVEVDGESLDGELAVNRRVRLPCGRGPRVAVDGTLRRTAVETTLSDLFELRPARARLCGPRNAAGRRPRVGLAAGSHTLALAATPRWRPLSLTLVGSGWRPGPESVDIGWRIEDWGKGDRSVEIGPRSGPTLLTVHENTNLGWIGTLDGERLQPVVVDGWQQGYVVPAGAAGTVELHYAPAAEYRLALVVGGGLLLVLAAAAMVDRRGSDAAPAEPARWPTWLGWAAVGLACFLLGGAAGIGVAAAVAGARILVVRRRRPVPAAIELAWAGGAFGAYLAVGVLLAWRPAGSVDYSGDGWPAQLLALAALAMVAVAGLTNRPAAEDPG